MALRGGVVGARQPCGSGGGRGEAQVPCCGEGGEGAVDAEEAGAVGLRGEVGGAFVDELLIWRWSERRHDDNDGGR